MHTQQKSANIMLRTQADIKATIERAAAFEGATVTQFVIATAYKQAQYVLEQEHKIQLTLTEQKRFTKALEQNKEPNKALKNLFAKHKKHAQ